MSIENAIASVAVNDLTFAVACGSCTLAVSDIEDLGAHVQRLGIDASQRNTGATVKTLMIVDLDGNHIAFAETIDKSMAR
ncbi:MAG: hypothetical protein M3O07_12815 [Pseudomonadota bacterium]|nr:hypothetical protein [Pseudomonadota bacterium]